MFKSFAALLTFIVLLPTVLCAQTSQSLPPVSNVIAVLTKTVEAKTATAGDELTLRTISDVVVDGELVIPKGSRLLGRIAEVTTKSKEQPQTVLAFVIDKAVKKALQFAPCACDVQHTCRRAHEIAGSS